MNSRKDCGHRMKFVGGRKKWAKRFAHKRVRKYRTKVTLRELMSL